MVYQISCIVYNKISYIIYQISDIANKISYILYKIYAKLILDILYILSDILFRI